jgi:hypothetical protein
MSAAEQFKAAVPSECGPDQGWRGGLERSRARRGVVRQVSAAPLPAEKLKSNSWAKNSGG